MRLLRITLASASPRRYELLRSLGLRVDVVVSGYEEPPCSDLSAGRTCGAARRRKAAQNAGGAAGAGGGGARFGRGHGRRSRWARPGQAARRGRGRSYARNAVEPRRTPFIPRSHLRPHPPHRGSKNASRPRFASIR